jgi:hypothetical protein
MKKFGELNDISKELLAMVPKLGPKDTAEYRLLTLQKDEENPGKWKIPYATGVRSRSTIIDPFHNEMAEIAYISSIKSRPTKSGRIEEPDIKPIAFLRQQAGRIVLRGDNPQDVLLHEYLYLCPLNVSSPVRNGESAIYDYVDVRADAKKGIKRMNRKLEAMGFINGLTPSDGLFDYAYMVARVESTDEEVAKYHLVEFAEADPDKFFDMVESMDSQIKVTYLRAISQGVLNYDAQTGTIRWAKSQEVITAIPKAVTRREDSFLLWAKSGAANMKLVDTIAGMVSNKRQIASEPATIEVTQDTEEEITQEVFPVKRAGRPRKESL